DSHTLPPSFHGGSSGSAVVWLRRPSCLSRTRRRSDGRAKTRFYSAPAVARGGAVARFNKAANQSTPRLSLLGAHTWIRAIQTRTKQSCGRDADNRSNGDRDDPRVRRRRQGSAQREWR